MKGKQTKKIAFFIFSLISGFFVSFSVFAANNLNIDWPDSPMGTGVTGTEPNSLSNLTQYFYEWGISIGALFAFISIVVAGFKYLTSTGDTNKLTEAKNRIKASFFGLALLLGTYLILNTINPQLVSLEIKNDPFNDNPLIGQSFVDYELTSKCAYAKLYKDAKEMKEDKNRKDGPTKNSGIGQLVEVSNIKQASLQFGKGENDYYNAVKFFSEPNLYKVVTVYKDDGAGNAIPVTEDPEKIKPEDYPAGYKRLLIKGETEEKYYIEAMGTDCKLYLHYENDCSTFWGGVANITYSTNNLVDNTNADIKKVMCVKLVENR